MATGIIPVSRSLIVFTSPINGAANGKAGVVNLDGSASLYAGSAPLDLRVIAETLMTSDFLIAEFQFHDRDGRTYVTSNSSNPWMEMTPIEHLQGPVTLRGNLDNM